MAAHAPTHQLDRLLVQNSYHQIETLINISSEKNTNVKILLSQEFAISNSTQQTLRKYKQELG